MRIYSKLATKNGFIFTLKNAWLPTASITNIIVEKNYDIFNFHFGVGSYKTFLYNPETKQLLISNKSNHLKVYEENAVQKKDNEYDDFVKGYLTDKSNNVIRLEGDVGKILRDKEQSHKLMKTLEMFSMNGANEYTKLRYLKGKKSLSEDIEYKLNYFMKTKIIW